MVDVKEAFMFSAIFVTLLSIPAASEQVKIEEDSKNGFEAVIDTNFSDRFNYDMEAGKEDIKMVDSESEFRHIQRPSKDVKKINTPEGTLKVEKSNDSIVRKVESPYGSLEISIKEGRRSESFSGMNRSRVEALKDDLMDELGKKTREASSKKNVALDRILPDVSVEVDEGGESEHINITNTGNSVVSADSWIVQNTEEQKYRFDRKLDPGETYTLYSKDYTSDIENSISEIDVTLYSTGGEIELRNRQGYLLDSESY